MTAERSRLLLLLAATDVQTAAQLMAEGAHDSAATLRELARLVELGFVGAVDHTGEVAAYRLTPNATRTARTDPPRRTLLVEDNLAIQELMTLVLEDMGTAVIIARVPAEAAALLDAITFDLVITDGFSRTPATVVEATADIRRAAGVTPVALFTAHRTELDDARAAGFRDLITKPFDLDTLEHQVRAILQ